MGPESELRERQLLPEIIQKASQSLVRLNSDSYFRTRASGFIADTEYSGGIRTCIVTASHPFQNNLCKLDLSSGAKLVVLFNIDNKRDIAISPVDNDFSVYFDATPLRISDSYKTHENVFLVANYFPADCIKIMPGRITGLGRNGLISYKLAKDRTSPGMSGSPVVNCNGEVIGVHVRGEYINFNHQTGYAFAEPLAAFNKQRKRDEVLYYLHDRFRHVIDLKK
jgi:S1-C subfamily serine protease